MSPFFTVFLKGERPLSSFNDIDNIVRYALKLGPEPKTPTVDPFLALLSTALQVRPAHHHRRYSHQPSSP